MIKFIVLCSVVALCVARSLNDETVPVLVKQDDAVVEPNNSEQVKAQEVIAAEDIVDESDLAAAIDSNSGDVNDFDKTRFLFRFATTTTTPLPMMQMVNLLLTLNSVGSGV